MAFSTSRSCTGRKNMRKLDDDADRLRSDLPWCLLHFHFHWPPNHPPSPTTHNQPVPDPLAHFHSIPWCHALLTHRSILHTAIPDRTPIATTESSLVRETLNTPRTVTACLTFLRYVKDEADNTDNTKPNNTDNTNDNSNSNCNAQFRMSEKEIEAAMKARGEDKENPFLEFGALVDLRDGVNGYAKTAHGGFFGVVLDEVMGTAANAQAKYGAFTAALTVRYKKPLYTPSVVVVRGRVVEKKGRKLTVKGSFADAEGNVLAEADGVWVTVDKDIGRWTDAKL
ncbi:hypothetical protein LHYA1_G004809 [Lachnellula hyalina]|uniref:Thioesterase domain-containing protein n=1 Tax=Lachnellula hyalina TaxID=1316788 RepID=A0A8H8TYN0_9HELO|nr:uncharacterized protein LHYA1_G004809 [Lachnellula hyalina]TVY26817.1 hypothetical protein LHYA1_G004809 [Lachnellula hyalina]